MSVSTLADFLPYTLSQKSASLVLTDSDAHTKKTLTALKKAGYARLTDIPSLAKPGKYFVTTDDFATDVLNDLLLQYGSGQITLHDKDTGTASWINPAYPGSSLVLVMTKDAVEHLESEGFTLLNAVGPALQL